MQRNSPDSPIGSLITLVRLEIDKLFEEVRKALARIHERLSRVESIEEPDNVKPQIPLKPHNIHEGAVEHLFNKVSIIQCEGSALQAK